MATPRLLHLTTTDISLELLLGPQLGAFADAGYEVIGAAAPGIFVAAIEARGVRFEPLEHATRSMALGADLRAAREVYRLFQRLQPAIVHTHTPKPGVYGRLAARAARVPVVVNTVHGLYAQPGDRWLKRVGVYSLERLAATASHAELVQNPEDLEVLRRLRVPEDRLQLLGNGIDLTRFRPPGPGERSEIRTELGIGRAEVIVGTVGRLVGEKGYHELFAAAEGLRSRAPEARLVVIGPHEPGKADAVDPEAIERAERAGVTFLGHRDDVERLYRAMDVFVLASHREGFPRSAMEAAATGVPLVVTDIRGCRQVVDDDVTGLVVPVRDPVALADAIVALVSAPTRRSAMGAAAAEKARREFDQRRVIDITLATYERLLAARGLSPAGGASRSRD